MKQQSITSINSNSPTYFIADIAANHDGSIDRAKKLIRLAAESGANAAKFQHFAAETIVSDRGFRELGGNLTHQATWDRSVFEVYKAASLPFEWTEELKSTCDDAGIEFFTAPYDLNLIAKVEPFIPVFKIGSGDITWVEAIETMANFGKPILLATGASSLDDVRRAVEVLESRQLKYVLMQCNTNYTANDENISFLNLKVLEQYKEMFPNAILGLSDHTSTEISVLGAIALGARVIEKHFTDDNNSNGPDHKFSLNPNNWELMVIKARQLEAALGNGKKIIEENEQLSVIVQRRALRYTRPITAGETISRIDLIPLRPAPKHGIPPYEIDKIVGRKLVEAVEYDQLVEIEHFNEY
jgi:N-acetylneuraminate synthase